jgi:hypothetical protein
MKTIFKVDTSDLNFSPFSLDFSPRFLEKNLVHFCLGNFAGSPRVCPGPLQKLQRPLFHMAGHTHVPLPGQRSKTDLLILEHCIATGPVNHATFQSAGPRADILKLEDCTVSVGSSQTDFNFVFVFQEDNALQ